MRRLIISVFIFTALILNLGCYSAQTAKTTPHKPAVTAEQRSNRPKILAFGDSLTAGFGLSERESYPYLLQEKLKADGYDYEVINAGVSGETSAGGLDRADWSLGQDNVQIVILELGANDLLRGLSVEQMKQNLDAIIKKAKAKNIRVLLCALAPPGSAVGEYQQKIASVFPDLAKENKVELLPFFLEGVVGEKNLNQADGIHPNAEGEKILTENVYKALKPMLKK